MLSKFKNFLKIYLRKRNFHQIHFESFQKSFEHFKEEDNKTTWNAEIFSKIILDNLKNLENLTIVEIGVARGGTSKYTIEKLDKKIKYYFGVDPYKANYDSNDTFSHYSQNYFDHCYAYVLNKIKDPRFRLIRLSSEKAVNLFNDNSIDAIYIDGDHKYEEVKKDILLWRNKVKKGGIIIGDDFKDFHGVKKAVEEIFSDYKLNENTWYVIK